MEERIKINIIIDESGSMQPRKNDAIGAYNSFIESQQKLNNDNIFMSLLYFSNDSKYQFKDANIRKIFNINENMYNPSGSTALYDAIGLVLTEQVKESYDKIMNIIITDGEENASTKFSKESVKTLISKAKEEKQVFMFLTCDENSIYNAEDIGISKGNTYSYKSRGFAGVANAMSAGVYHFEYDKSEVLDTENLFSAAGVDTKLDELTNK